MCYLWANKQAKLGGNRGNNVWKTIQHNADLIEKLGPVVTWQQIISANIQKVQVGFVENGRGKLVDIQVAFMCANQNKDKFFEKQLGNVKIISIPTPKIVY